MTKPNAKDWRELPTHKWNTSTVLAYFTDMNRECFGIETYLPFRNWATERGMVKRALETYGSAILRAAFDECFRTYRPTREYPILTAGFAISYRINAIIPKLLAEQAEKERRQTEESARPAADDVKKWL